MSNKEYLQNISLPHVLYFLGLPTNKVAFLYNWLIKIILYIAKYIFTLDNNWRF